MGERAEGEETDVSNGRSRAGPEAGAARGADAGRRAAGNTATLGAISR